ncbi:GAF domain-containing protein [Paenibacillus macerans]|uniref:GAF domain-containing protein n=1 Tax=Paenibacillus macerans TaxID=44252 RepID=A0A6N8F148_PAEMA|nr:GAF domain-containing protein [Paenibacillus macerans]MBS5913269.1 GAF domain-containing protein [Paenibacillus macerans]MDU5948324.1 GAF domain-containing protein [Paenibacillus macerans]MED4958920.1 GAF domain-containing protein [Paenibacillus macerans]MUG26207.1 GAF domain-containing protein [Paenibacillus macerans]UMV47156.1 GAF domain-containing protein [Paenibacillus macerans]
MERLALLFEALERLTGVADIAYHEIREGRLNPVLKTKTDHLGVERWKSVHAQNPVYIEHDRLLRELMAHPQTTAVVQDVKNDPRSADEFFLFGIDSIMVIPVMQDGAVQGIVVVASIGKLHFFSAEEIERAEALVNEYRDAFQH